MNVAMHRADYFVGSRSGMTRGELRAGETAGRWRRVVVDGYRFGPHDVTALDRALGRLVVTDGVARGRHAD
jgi:hypothetical protein